MSKALFIDRDGVINREKNYVHKIEDFEFIDGIFDALREFTSKGFLIIVITNQAGIARGLYSEKVFEELTKWMIKRFESEGVKITDVFFDPTHPEHGKGSYKKESYYRKPNPGMILQAAEKYKTDLEKSVLVGDKPGDAEAGKRAGVGSLFLVRTGHQFREEDVPQGCVVVDNLKDVLINLH
jgi:D-glycero-D-manno-heptose 1,7-bisphosphate phosphatase